MVEHEERFAGTIVAVIKQKDVNGAKIRPLWADENDESDDVFCHFSEAPYLKEGMTVSFRLDHELKSARWAAFEVSHIIKDALITRPEWYPSPVCLDLMRNAWKATKDREKVIAIEIDYMHREAAAQKGGAYMANKKDRRKAEKEDRIGRRIYRASKRLKKTKIWEDSKEWSEYDLELNA